MQAENWHYIDLAFKVFFGYGRTEVDSAMIAYHKLIHRIYHLTLLLKLNNDIYIQSDSQCSCSIQTPLAAIGTGMQATLPKTIRLLDLLEIYVFACI